MHFFKSSILLLLPLAASSAAAAVLIQEQFQPEPRDATNDAAPPHLAKRQDFSALIGLASKAGIPLPTSPALLLSLAPIASALAADLPTAPVLSALETAAPPGFLSKIVHDPSYAADFQSSFAAGNSPSWFLALPTSVRDYLHTYNGFTTVAQGVASAVQVLQSGGAETGFAATTDSDDVAETGAAATGSEERTGSTMMTTASATDTAGAVDSAAAAASASASLASAVASSSLAAEASSLTSSSSAGAAAARETGALAAGVVAAAGVLGLAIAL